MRAATSDADLLEIPLPIREFYVELTNRCNFQCAFCPSRTMTRPTGMMALELFRALMDEIALSNLAGIVPLHIVGEPLLHPHLVEAVTYAVRKGVPISVCTNGSLLRGAVLTGLARSGLPELGISLVSRSEEMFREYRAPALGYLAYYRTILDAVRELHAAGGPTQVKVFLIDTRTRRFLHLGDGVPSNFGESPLQRTVAALALDLRCALGYPATPAEMAEWVNGVAFSGPARLEVAPRVSIETRLFLDWGNALCNGTIYPSRRGYCGLGLQRMAAVNWSGDFCLCGGDYNGMTSLGRITPETDILHYLHSHDARRIYTGFQRYRVEHPHCQRCMGGPTRLSSLVRRIAGSYVHKFWVKNHPLQNYRYPFAGTVV